MSEQSDNIEARLSAYVDGILDEAQRGEIEAYLDRNPEHRQLIDELVRQRSFLRDLPRERAPSDVLDSFQARLERSVLLEDMGAVEAAGMKIRRRKPNFAAVAAILLLATGLGVVVWMALPHGEPTNYSVAPVPEAASEGRTGGRPITDDATATRALADGMERTAVPTDETAGAAQREREMARAGAALGVASLPADAGAAGAQAQADGALGRSVAGAAGAGAELAPAQMPVTIAANAVAKRVGAPDRTSQVVLVVSADDPAVAQDEVRRFLVSNSIAFDPAPVGPATVQVVVPDELWQKEAATAPAAIVQSGAVAVGGPAGAAEARNEYKLKQELSQQQQQQQPAQQRLQRRFQQQFADDQTIVARGMTRGQATELANSLSGQRGHSVQIIDEPTADTSGAATQAAPASGERVARSYFTEAQDKPQRMAQAGVEASTTAATAPSVGADTFAGVTAAPPATQGALAVAQVPSVDEQATPPTAPAAPVASAAPAPAPAALPSGETLKDAGDRGVTSGPAVEPSEVIIVLRKQGGQGGGEGQQQVPPQFVPREKTRGF
jgi:hypothetical protein